MHFACDEAKDPGDADPSPGRCRTGFSKRCIWRNNRETPRKSTGILISILQHDKKEILMKKVFETDRSSCSCFGLSLMVGCSTVPSLRNGTTVAPADTVLLLEQGEAVPALTNLEISLKTSTRLSAAARCCNHGWSYLVQAVKFNVRKTTRYNRKGQTTS